jgi:hypothetical protein
VADRVSVSNLVLAKLGEPKKITDPNDDTRAARAIARVWDVTRDMALRAHPWNFAMKREILTASASLPVWGWGYAFPLPSDFIRLDLDTIEPSTLRGENMFQIEGNAMLCDALGPVYVRYVRRVAEVGLWDPMFVEAFANLLAWQTADDITGDLARKDRCWKAWEDSLPAAKGVDGRENPPQPAEDSSWVTARYGR